MIVTTKNKSMKRLGIFLFYDKDGIVDDYIPYMLEDLNKNIDKLVIVCNGKLSVEGRQKFEKLSSNIVVRENKGFDVWAYKEGMEYIGWEGISEYDEMVLINYTMFGPLYPFKEMFDEMGTRNIDFWGITKHYGSEDDWTGGNMKYGYIPDFIQSFFIVVRNKMLTSYEFKKYWDTMRPIGSYIESMAYHEGVFTKDFCDSGFISDVYINTDDLKEYTQAPTTYTPLELIKRKCPIVKRKVFFDYYDYYLRYNTGEVGLETYEFIRDNLDYDMKLIWDNILRTSNQADIKKNMQLNYILPTKFTEERPNKNAKVALIMHLYFEDLIETCYTYASSMPNYADVYITTNTEVKKNAIIKVFEKLAVNKVEVKVIENRGRDVSSLLVASKKILMDYDYVCFAHDKKTAQIKPFSVGEAFMYKCFENILGSKSFVENIIHTFEDNPQLGLMTPPPPNHGIYYSTIGLEWSNNFKNTKELMEKLGMKNVPLDSNKEPIAPLGTMFWFRPKALKTLIEYDWEYNDFPKEPNEIDGTLLHAIERIYPYAAQYEGYYPGWVMSDKFAKIEVTNLQHMLRQLNGAIFENGRYRYKHLDEIVYGVRTSITKNKSMKYFIKSKLRENLPPKMVNVLKRWKRKVYGR
ncbi:rhamnan synthesis F family protein [Paenibacillus sp. GSMTC-2017]|uniref:rhamnan synthesis F family protein n=1 Tax=Paenibacillus sp. GSMTC-2017 TaxID=2794350 RepID=UPI0018D84417|nr:rhamnan synthesis F family protein [Paenibacillus sp. GSMTC-2017]MBH5319147.1 rhamnan synthesis F family protein [Paenibacillus sp. GSMTC-2017]